MSLLDAIVSAAFRDERLAGSLFLAEIITSAATW